MESQKRLRQRNLGYFLLKLLDSNEIEGLQWIDKDKKLFKIPWMDKRSPIHANVENILVKKWEIYNGRHTEGQTENWTAWKQTFRGALGKSPFVCDVQEMHQLSIPNPFKVYMFTDKVNIHNPESPPKRKRQRKSPDSFQCAQRVPSPQQHNFESSTTEYPLSESSPGIPQVVIEELKNFTSSTNLLAYEQNIQTSPSDISQCQPDHYNNEIVNAFTCSPNDYTFISSQNGDYTFNELQLSSPEMFVDTPKPTTPVSLMDIIDPFVIRFQAFYLDKFIQDGVIDNNGVRLFFNSEPVNKLEKYSRDQQVREKICGPLFFKQEALPAVNQCIHIMDKHDYEKLGDVQDVLKNMERGLLLYSEGRNLFAYRLCTTRVFATYGNKRNLIIDRRLKDKQLLFDMDIFENDLRLYKLDPVNNTRPPSKVILTFGEEFCVGVKPLVHVELIIEEAENMLRREMPHGRPIQFSGFDSADLLLAEFNRTLTLNSSTVCA